jgi:hypothetical protein
MHAEPLHLEFDRLLEAEPIKPAATLSRVMWWCVLVGVVTFCIGLVTYSPAHLWGAYYTNLNFFMGLAAGSVIICAAVQIVRATWSVPVRRLAEANAAFLPWAFILFLCSYFGREYLFPWGRGPMPGREWWMQADFVYLRNGLLLGFLFYLMHRFVRLSLRSDVGFLREKSRNKNLWRGARYQALTAGWKGSESEVDATARKLSWNAPVLVLAYALIYSIYAFEMIMGMDAVWFSTMFGGFIFVGNIYLAWAVLSMSTVYHARRNPDFASTLGRQQFWDLGKLTFGFCMLWGYLFFSQFLPQWYGNLPEETLWMITRTREYPWKAWAWVVFPMCFVIPFIMLLSEDVKKNTNTLASICLVVFLGKWAEQYILIMPQMFPHQIPFSPLEVGLFFGFLGAYVLSIQHFIAKYPLITISHPQAQGRVDW